MKLISTMLALSLTMSAFAGVREDVETLGKLAMGFEEYKVKGKTAHSILKNWVAQTNGDDTKLVFKEIADMDYGDEVEEGFTSTKSAKEMGSFAIGALEERLDHAEESEVKEIKKQITGLKKGWAPLIEKLDRQGVKFGYTGWGPGYCGVSFIELIIVDEKEQKVYEVYLSESGEC